MKGGNTTYNYFDLISKFEESMRYTELHSAERSLWYRMAFEWNKLYFKAKPLILSEEELRGPIHMSHDQFIRARKKLVENRYIEHIQNKGRSAAAYKMFYLPISLQIEENLEQTQNNKIEDDINIDDSPGIQ